MSEQHDGGSTGGAGERPDPRSGRPSPMAARRLAEAVSERTDAYRLSTSVELSFVDALLRMRADDAARDAVEDCGRMLRAYAQDIESAVAAAAAERDAEQPVAAAAAVSQLAAARATLDAAAAGAQPTPAGAARAGAEPTTAGPARQSHRPARRLRRVLVGAAGVSAVALALLPVLHTPRLSVQLTTAELEVQQELAEARYRMAARAHRPTAPRVVMSEARELHGEILALSDRALERESVRRELRLLLDVEREALEDVADRTAEARDLINEIHAIRESLELDAAGAPDPKTGAEVPAVSDLDALSETEREGPQVPLEVEPPDEPPSHEVATPAVDEAPPAVGSPASHPPAVDQDGAGDRAPIAGEADVPTAP